MPTAAITRSFFEPICISSLKWRCSRTNRASPRTCHAVTGPRHARRRRTASEFTTGRPSEKARQRIRCLVEHLVLRLLELEVDLVRGGHDARAVLLAVGDLRGSLLARPGVRHLRV